MNFKKYILVIGLLIVLGIQRLIGDFNSIKYLSVFGHLALVSPSLRPSKPLLLNSEIRSFVELDFDNGIKKLVVVDKNFFSRLNRSTKTYVFLWASTLLLPERHLSTINKILFVEFCKNGIILDDTKRPNSIKLFRKTVVGETIFETSMRCI